MTDKSSPEASKPGHRAGYALPNVVSAEAPLASALIYRRMTVVMNCESFSKHHH
jgi:hypothetical protein